MAVDIALHATLESFRQESLRNGLTTSEGIALFARALASGLPRVIATAGRTVSSNAAASVVGAASTEAALPAPPVAVCPTRVSDDPWRTHIDTIRGIWADALHLPAVLPDDNVFELGADSLIALQVVPIVEQRLACQLNPIVCYEAPTPRMLASLILSRASEQGRQDRPAQSVVPLSSGAAP